MKTIKILLGYGWLSIGMTGRALAAETNYLTPQQMFEGGTNTYNNWIDFSGGGFLIDGSRARFQQQHQLSGGAFGGIEGFHYTTNVNTNTTLTLDGRGIFDEHDYKLRLGIERENKGYLRFSYDQSRIWWDGDGGFFSPSGPYEPLAPNGLGLDRGNFSFEAGLTPENGVNAIFKYSHAFREGDQDSTRWGDVHPAGGALVNGLAPSFESFNEHSDSFQLDLTDNIKATDLGLGVRFETGKLDDALKVLQYPGEPIQQKITDRQIVNYDMFDVHSFTETWVRSNVLVSSGFSYSLLENGVSGSRIYGSDFDVGRVPNPLYGFGYYGLNGNSRLHEYVVDLNLLYRPTPVFTITPSVRLQKDDGAADSGGLETLGANTPVPFSANNNTGDLDVRGRLDFAYRGFTNWVLTARGDLTEAEGNLNEYGGLIPVAGIGRSPVESGVYDHNFVQKYSVGARWYPSRKVTLDAGGYYKYDAYHYDSSADSTPNNSFTRYPGYLAMQDFATCDANLRLNWRVLRNVSLISRYEYQWSTIHTEPDLLAGLPNVESSVMRGHILAQDVNWTPWSRLSLQGGFNYVLNDTKTPASDVTQAILNSENNYWTMNFSSSLVLDNKTDLDVSYFYYQADDYVNNSPLGVPYGAGGEEHSVTATLTRRLSARLRLSLKYGYFRYLDSAYGGRQDYSASLIYATLRYRF